MAKNAKQPEAGKVVVVEQGAKAPVTLSAEEAKAMPAPKAKPAPKKAPAAKATTAKAARKPAAPAAKASAPAASGAAAPKASAGAKAPAMKGQALGMVETRGLVAAIEAADSMVKTADVALLGIERVGSGLVTVLVCGEVSAVTSAVQSGAAAAARLGEVVSTDVIARPVDDIEAVLPAQQ